MMMMMMMRVTHRGQGIGVGPVLEEGPDDEDVTLLGGLVKRCVTGLLI